jgi:signal transduction histidine kinase
MPFSKNTSLRYKIFVAIVSVNLLFMAFMAAFNFYRESIKISISKKQELKSTQNKVQETFSYILRNTKSTNKAEINRVLDTRIFEISNINNVGITIYELNGNVITSSRVNQNNLEKSILDYINKKRSYFSEGIDTKDKNIVHYNSFDFLNDKSKPIAIIGIEKIANKASLAYHFKILFKQYLLAIIILFIISGYAAWYISRSLTKKIETISKSLSRTNVEFLETPIEYNEKDEVKPLVDSYNAMLQKLQEQTNTLAKTEREEAWRDMARQIAHEINNPLTPLKLSVQNFQRKYNPNDADNDAKVKNLTKVVVNQIDIISSITRAFSDFAKMPVNNDMVIDVVKTVKYAVDIFPDHIIEFYTNADEVYYKIDNIYLTRVITNIVKNGIQSISHNDKKVIVEIENFQDKFIISIKDNGSGIPEENRNRVFEQKFTTKATGMGLGLYMVKKIVEDYNGKIWFETELGEGTTFFLEFIK